MRQPDPIDAYMSAGPGWWLLGVGLVLIALGRALSTGWPR